MPKIKTIQPLGSEGTIKFLLTPIQNGTNRLYLIDIGSELKKNRITLLITKDIAGGRFLTLEVYGKQGISVTASQSFPSFQLGTAFRVELEWSSQEHVAAVYIDDKEDEFLKVMGEAVDFDSLGDIVHAGEDIEGNNRTEMLTAENR